LKSENFNPLALPISSPRW